jgi:hypothetical protein
VILAGREVGDFALLVGVDDHDMRQWLPSSEENFYRLAAPRGVLDVYVDRAQRHQSGLALECLGDSLHPSKHAALVASLRASGVPVIATTHSADLVDCVSFDEVFVCAGDVVRCLADHPEAAEWRTLLRAGEFWGTVGEGWVTG